MVHRKWIGAHSPTACPMSALLPPLLPWVKPRSYQVQRLSDVSLTPSSPTPLGATPQLPGPAPVGQQDVRSQGDGRAGDESGGEGGCGE